jgi:hypothetical protein
MGKTFDASSCARIALAFASHALNEKTNAKPLRKILIREFGEKKKLFECSMPPQKARQHPTQITSRRSSLEAKPRVPA